MVHGCQIRNQSDLYYLTFQIVQWTDLFTRQVYRDIIIESLNYCQKNKGLEVYAYVIMSGHPKKMGHNAMMTEPAKAAVSLGSWLLILGSVIGSNHVHLLARSQHDNE
jgi:hypothetical protein